MITSFTIKNSIVTEHFFVLDQNNEFVDDIPLTEFEFLLFENDVLITPTGYYFQNLGGGFYSFNFIPQNAGNYYLILTHSFFTKGKYGHIRVHEDGNTNFGTKSIINEIWNEYFTVVDSNSVFIQNIPLTEFQIYLFDPSGSEVSTFYLPVKSELSGGSYKVTFTPDILGIWFMVVMHDTYFPKGKISDIFVCDRIEGGTGETVYADSSLAVSKQFIELKKSIILQKIYDENIVKSINLKLES